MTSAIVDRLTDLTLRVWTDGAQPVSLANRQQLQGLTVLFKSAMEHDRAAIQLGLEGIGLNQRDIQAQIQQIETVQVFVGPLLEVLKVVWEIYAMQEVSDVDAGNCSRLILELANTEINHAHWRCLRDEAVLELIKLAEPKNEPQEPVVPVEESSIGVYSSELQQLPPAVPPSVEPKPVAAVEGVEDFTVVAKAGDVVTDMESSQEAYVMVPLGARPEVDPKEELKEEVCEDADLIHQVEKQYSIGNYDVVLSMLPLPKGFDAFCFCARAQARLGNFLEAHALFAKAKAAAKDAGKRHFLYHRIASVWLEQYNRSEKQFGFLDECVASLEQSFHWGRSKYAACVALGMVSAEGEDLVGFLHINRKVFENVMTMSGAILLEYGDKKNAYIVMSAALADSTQPARAAVARKAPPLEKLIDGKGVDLPRAVFFAWHCKYSGENSFDYSEEKKNQLSASLYEAANLLLSVAFYDLASFCGKEAWACARAKGKNAIAIPSALTYATALAKKGDFYRLYSFVQVARFLLPEVKESESLAFYFLLLGFYCHHFKGKTIALTLFDDPPKTPTLEAYVSIEKSKGKKSRQTVVITEGLIRDYLGLGKDLFRLAEENIHWRVIIRQYFPRKP